MERHTDAPLLRIERLADRAVGGGLVLMLAAAGSIFGLFLLSSLYLQNVLGMGPLATGLAFIPLALAAGAGAHAAGHITHRHGVRGPLTVAFVLAAGRHDAARPRRPDRQLRRATCSPACSSPASVSASPSSPSRSRSSPAPAADETGMISGLNSTGHEIGGTIGIAAFSSIAAGAGALVGPQAASGISNAFIAAAVLAGVASVVSFVALPAARQFVPKLRLNPSSMPVH